MFDLLKLIEMENTVMNLAFSDNLNLGATSHDSCAYVFDKSGNLLNKICGNNDMEDASYCCGKFGFVNWDEYVYITDENGNLIKNLYVGGDYNWSITMTENGFVVCRGRCALFDLNGNKIWDLDVGHVDNGPSYYKGYWYVADYWRDKLLIVKDGEVVKEISYGEEAYDTAVCDKYLTVSTYSYLYLYDLNDPVNPSQLWSVGGFNEANQVTFSPDCKYIVVTDGNNQKLKIFNIEGDLIDEKKYWDDVVSVDWKNNRIAVGVGADLLICSTLPLHCFI